MEVDKLVLSSLGHTWILDLDGTIVRHNGYLEQGCDELLVDTMRFLNSIPKEDMIIFITSRKRQYKKVTEDFLRVMGIRYDAIIYDAPYGERIVINDKKPSGLSMWVGLDVDRNTDKLPYLIIDNSL